jgi:peptidoglycan/LPS O-acetylase OafA/YrhL
MRFLVLDLVRCFAIALLLLSHIGQTVNSPLGSFFGIQHFYYVSLGGFAVTVFLILSGTVLELQYGSRDVTYFQFVAKRCLRIYPIYYLSLLFGITIYFLHSYHESGHFLANLSKLGVGDIILSITGGYAFAGKLGGPFVATSWFIGLIISMYILFPFLSRGIKKRPNITISALLLISFLSRLIIGRQEIFPTRPLDWFPLCRVFEFSLGIYLAIVLPRNVFNYLKSSRRVGLFISFISEISFPLFLIHAPLLIIISYLSRSGTNQLLSICLFFLISFFLSWVVLVIDKNISKSFIVNKSEKVVVRKEGCLTSG